MSDVDQMKEEVSQLRAAFDELTNGRWDWNADGTAIAVLLFSASGLVTGALSLLMQMGVLGG